MVEKHKKRRRGAILIETKKGILMVAWKGGDFMLPGGGAHWYESRKMAAKREVKEELGLKAKKLTYIFSYVSPRFKNKQGILTKNYVKVFKAEVEGVPKPLNEIHKIGYWKKGSKLKIMNGAKIAMREYQKYLKNLKRQVFNVRVI
jgi:8-oxo-dGTP pyrophosphatase MutT (NUDIX family)